MFLDWISRLRDKKVDTSTTRNPQSERSLEEAQEQVQIPDFGATFLACLYSNPAWHDTMGRETSKTNEHKTKNWPTRPKSFAPLCSAEEEQRVPPGSLEVVEMYVKRATPIEWTGEYKEHDLKRKIEAYNLNAQGMEIAIHENGIDFGGHIRVNMDFTSIWFVPPPVVDTVNLAKSTVKHTPTVTIVVKILPPNTMEMIDINSETTAKQMIVKLFKSLRYVNSPRDFALYEYEEQIDETAGTLTKKLTRIADNACPLKVVLHWPIPHAGRKLVLQKNYSWGLRHTFKYSFLDIFAKTMGLKKWQVDIGDVKKNLRTGFFELTYSKLEMKLCGFSMDFFMATIFLSIILTALFTFPLFYFHSSMN